MDQELTLIAKKLGAALLKHKLHLVVAESCTGGLVAAAITSIPGCSEYFERGFVTYSNQAKKEMLGVKEKSLEKFGAVSEEVAREMAEGALLYSHAQISVAITGIAGPSGGTEDKPVGTVCFAWSRINKKTNSLTQHFHGSREDIRNHAVSFALERCLALV